MTGRLVLASAGTATAPTLAGSRVGSLACSGPTPIDLGAPTTVRGATSGRCGSTPAA
ncbi:hypothetical protein OG470_17140 [Micromonospora sp. NBC_00389]|uniref:hypothetical protein n=1 Tax=Micromonospora sp. NBC_00389 TaxID=2903586 RepID=UPI002E2362D3